MTKKGVCNLLQPTSMEMCMCVYSLSFKIPSSLAMHSNGRLAQSRVFALRQAYTYNIIMNGTETEQITLLRNLVIYCERTQAENIREEITEKIFGSDKVEITEQ
jgi:hypothetical protein